MQFNQLDTYTWIRLERASALKLGRDPETVYAKVSEPNDAGRAAPIIVRGSRVLVNYADSIDVRSDCEVILQEVKVHDAAA